MPSSLTIAAVGDVFLNREDPTSAFAHVAEVFDEADVLVGNCEGIYTDDPKSFPTVGVFRVMSGTRNAAPLVSAGFDVMSIANNHVCDAGHQALLDMQAMLERQGIATVGAGGNIRQARAPCTIVRKGLKLAFLACTAVYPGGFEAKEQTPGVWALRVHTHYFVHPEAFGRTEPGADPAIRTFAFPEDVAALVDAVQSARKEADVVIACMHWGKSTRPALLTDYERACAHALIDAGTEIIFGHHHHFLRGVEIYRDKPIFYGLGHFAFDMPGLETGLTPAQLAHMKRFGEFSIYPRAGYPLLPFHPDSRMTMIGLCRLSGSGVAEVGLVPCEINAANQPVALEPASPDGQRVLAYLRDITRQAEISTSYHEGGAAVGAHNMVRVVQAA